jgi:hypothetical protein
LYFEDTNVEGAQDVMRYNPRGMLVYHDELSGWFGSTERYTGGGKVAHANRGFWLRTWNGGRYPVDRSSKGRGHFLIENMGISLLGGIQPEVIRKIANEYLRRRSDPAVAADCVAPGGTRSRPADAANRG